MKKLDLRWASNPNWWERNENYAKVLSQNTSMLASIRQSWESKMPFLAECGGFLYLHRELEGSDGIFYPLAGVIPDKAWKTNRLGRFGYITKSEASGLRKTSE